MVMKYFMLAHAFDFGSREMRKTRVSIFHIRRHPWLLIAIVAVALFGGTCFEPKTADQLVEHLKASGLLVAEPSSGPLTKLLHNYEKGMEEFPDYSGGRPDIRTLEIEGVLTTIYRFEGDTQAGDFMEVAASNPSTASKLPERIKDYTGRAEYMHHKNFVLRLVKGVGGKDDSKEAAKIEAALKSF